MDYRIISIGALSSHELWPNDGGGRTAHATTTLIRSGDKTILVDPGMPGQIVVARLAERAGLAPADVTDVFLTCFRPAHRMGLDAFENARWQISEMERESVGSLLIEHLQEQQDPAVRKMIQQDIALLKRFGNAPDRLAEQVDLFPLPGFTPGTCGLIVSHLNSTTLIAGDAVASAEHLEQGRVLKGAFDVSQAKESLAEAMEIADVVVPGHDNVLLNPSRRPM